MTATEYLRLSPLEIAMGMPLDESSAHLSQAQLPRAHGGARRALRTVLARMLHTGPVFVSFSGGRDSSAVLAVATSVAREHSWDLPVPVTHRYPGLASADEDEWQELVLGHLGIRDRVVLDITDQHYLLGDGARASMAVRGLVWPAAANLQHGMLDVARGATLLTGEGGDELLGARRSAPVARVLRTLRRHHRPSVAHLWYACHAVVRQPARDAAATARQVQHEIAPWLRGVARHRFVQFVADDSTEPLRWDRSVARTASRSLGRALFHNLDLVARDYDVRIRHPLHAPEFVAAWIADGGRWGFTGRTAAMRYLFADVLPEPILSRSTKAYFNGARIGPAERAFARQWDGRGLDPQFVDREVLRQAWLAEEPGGRLDTALMAAWMASEGLPLDGPG